MSIEFIKWMIRRTLRSARPTPILQSVALVVLTLSSCTSQESSPVAPLKRPAIARSRTLVIGDIDPDTPARRISRLQPLGAYLEAALRDHQIEAVRIVIARSINEMAELLSTGSVDVYIDSVFPSLSVQQLARTRFILRRWVQDAPEYHCVFVAGKDSGILSLEGLFGRVIAFQESYSTSGFFLPSLALIEREASIRQVSDAAESVGADEIGYVFTRDEENTIEMVLTGLLPAGAISSQEYEDLPTQFREAFVVIHRTADVPRLLVSVRGDFDARLVDALKKALTEMSPSDSPSLVLGDDPAAWTWKFDEIPPQSREAISFLKSRLPTVQP